MMTASNDDSASGGVKSGSSGTASSGGHARVMGHLLWEDRQCVCGWRSGGARVLALPNADCLLSIANWGAMVNR